MKVLFVIGLIGLTFISTTFCDYQCSQGVDTAKQIEHPLYHFGGQLYKKISQEKPDKNIIFSPVSIALALAIAQSGAGGETQTELRKLLAGDQNSEPTQYEALRAALETGNSTSKVILKIVNGLFFSKDFTLNPEFLRKARLCYDAQIEKMDFKNTGEALLKINHWAANATKERIPQLFGPEAISDRTTSVLANAIYFKAPWDEHFWLEQDQRDFYKYGRDNENQKVNFFTRVDNFDYAEDDDVRIVKIPFCGDDIYFDIMLPKARNGLEGVEQNMTAEKFKALRQNIKSTRLNLTLPRFTIRTPIKLAKMLNLPNMFSDSADFSRMSGQRLKVDDVIHEAFIKVHENGTEAAAATAVVISNRMSLEQTTDPPAIPFFVDHPFSFTIAHKDVEAPIFMGKVNYVEESEAK